MADGYFAPKEPTEYNSRIRFGSRLDPFGSLENDHSFSRRLFVQKLISFSGLIERPAIGENCLDVDAAIHRERSAFLHDVR